ncbi:MAG: inositol-3-phosphate synthase [Vulcanimicrobiaceae bacterium]
MTDQLPTFKRKLGVLVVGFGGAVATTAVAGLELVRSGRSDTTGLPLADSLTSGLAEYDEIVFGGWDLHPDDLAAAAKHHRMLENEQLTAVAPALAELRPMAAIGAPGWCVNVTGCNALAATGHRATIASLQRDIAAFRTASGADGCVVVNLASVERWPDRTAPKFLELEAFERALDGDDAEIPPAMLYAYAAIDAGVPYGNFTPSLAADVPALVELAVRRNVPVAGKDGKTGQTMLKTVIAPALRARALHVDGWFSTNILGNRDGEALADPASLASKLATKESVLDSILGYPVENHLVQINYYKPRGDNKEAWDNVDVVGFLGQKMQIKIDFLCRDSILAAPLVIEIARTLDLASQRGEGGIQEQLGVFFKAPMTVAGNETEHDFGKQERRLREWLASERKAAVTTR